MHGTLLINLPLVLLGHLLSRMAIEIIQQGYLSTTTNRVTNILKQGTVTREVLCSLWAGPIICDKPAELNCSVRS